MPQRLRIYLEIDLKTCSFRLTNLTETPKNTQVNLDPFRTTFPNDQAWNTKLEYKINQSRNRTQTHIEHLMASNESFVDLIEKAEHLPNYALRIGLPSTLLCSGPALTVFLVVYCKLRIHRSSDSLPFSNLNLFSLAKNLSTQPITVNSEPTPQPMSHDLEINFKEIKEQLLQKIQLITSQPPDLLEESMGQLRKSYAAYHDANVELRNHFQLKNNSDMVSELDFERQHLMPSAFQQAVAVITGHRTTVAQPPII